MNAVSKLSQTNAPKPTRRSLHSFEPLEIAIFTCNVGAVVWHSSLTNQYVRISSMGPVGLCICFSTVLKFSLQKRAQVRSTKNYQEDKRSKEYHLTENLIKPQQLGHQIEQARVSQMAA